MDVNDKFVLLAFSAFFAAITYLIVYSYLKENFTPVLPLGYKIGMFISGVGGYAIIFNHFSFFASILISTSINLIPYIFLIFEPDLEPNRRRSSSSSLIDTLEELEELNNQGSLNALSDPISQMLMQELNTLDSSDIKALTNILTGNAPPDMVISLRLSSFLNGLSNEEATTLKELILNPSGLVPPEKKYHFGFIIEEVEGNDGSVFETKREITVDGENVIGRHKRTRTWECGHPTEVPYGGRCSEKHFSCVHCIINCIFGHLTCRSHSIETGNGRYVCNKHSRAWLRQENEKKEQLKEEKKKQLPPGK